MPRQIEKQPKLPCSGVWGGVRNLDQDINVGGVVASLYSSSCDGGKGGDIYYFGVCKDDNLTRLAIADVVGHGQAVSDVSEYIYVALKTHMCNPDSGSILANWNGTKLVIAECSDELCDDGNECTDDFCDPSDPEAGDDGCVHDYQVQIFGDICEPFDPPDAPQPSLDDILCVLDDFVNGADVDGCECDGFRFRGQSFRVCSGR